MGSLFYFYKMKKAIINFLIKLFTSVGKFAKKRLNALYELKYFIEFEDRKDDIYIVTYPKSGTTWMQMIIYLLIYKKEPDFDHIYNVSPWLSNEAFKRSSAKRVNELPSPRFFKSHDRYDKFVPGFKGKIIYVYRNVFDLTVSYFYHKKHYNDSKLELQQLIDESFNPSKEYNWFNYHEKWLINKNNHPIFYVSYENLKLDLEGAIKQLAQFLEIPLSDELLELVKKYASFEYMKANEQKFGEQPEEKHQMVYNQFIRKGEVGSGKEELTDEQRNFLTEKYKEIIEPLIK